MKYLIFRTSWGWIGISSTDMGLRKLVLPRPSVEEVEETLFIKEKEAKSDELKGLSQRLERYLEGYPETFSDSVDLSGAAPFQKEVLLALRGISYGETVSYFWLASKIGRPQAPRAIGQALAKNPLPIILPCHRVIGKRGDLVGYSGSLGLKRFLLELEAKKSNDRLPCNVLFDKT